MKIKIKEAYLTTHENVEVSTEIFYQQKFKQGNTHSSRVAGSIPVEGLSAKYSWCLKFTPYCS
jgi:hypothetical protein